MTMKVCAMGAIQPTQGSAPTNTMRQRLRGRIPAMGRILAATGQPGMSVGVIHNGEVVLDQSLGYSNVSTEARADRDTLYGIGSLTKAFVTACLAVLVDENNIQWNDRVSDLLPNLRMVGYPILAEEMTVVDLVCHRCGVTSLDQLVQGLDGKILAAKEHAINLMNELPKRRDLRTEFYCTNAPFSVAGQIIEEYGGCGRWDEFLQAKILSPLSMDRTTAHSESFLDDVILAQPSVVVADGTAHVVAQPEISASTLHGCAGGIRSSTRDMLKWAQYMLHAHSQAELGGDEKPAIARCLQGTTIIGTRSTLEGEYCLGWVRQTTPAILGMISPNRRYHEPVTGRGSMPKLIYSHNGDVLGYEASFCLIPEEDAALVVLTNGTGLGDCTDWIMQDIVQTMLHFESQHNYVDLAKSSAKIASASYHDLFVEPLEKHRVKGTPQRPVSDFVGEYTRFEKNRRPALRISLKKDSETSLLLVVNGHLDQAYRLHHYHYDTWTLAPSSSDEAYKRGFLLLFDEWEELVVSFGRLASGMVGGLSWKLEGVLVEFKRVVS